MNPPGLRLLELQNEGDALRACALVARPVPDANLRGWAAVARGGPFLEGLQRSGLLVVRGERGFLALGNLAQLCSAGRSLADSLEMEGDRLAARELMERAASIDSPAAWELPRGTLPARTAVMGIVNATPDSFSDGGAYHPVEQGLRLAEEGADILDVGGESTRPNAEPVSVEEERARTIPVVRELAARTRLPISIDTTKAEVAAAALDAGAEIVNDVSGLARDPAMGAAARGAALCLMHMRGTPREMQSKAVYGDLLGEVQDELWQALRRARDAGFPDGRIALDPGLGFAKTAEHNLLLLRRLRELLQLGRPLVVGASRKAFLGKLTGRAEASQRQLGSVVAAALAAWNGAAVVRVHDVAATREALSVAGAVRTSGD